MSMLITIPALLFIVIILAYRYSKSKLNYWRKRGVAGPEPLPIIGNTKNLILRKAQTGTWLRDAYDLFDDKYVGVYIFHEPLLVVKDPELLKAILVTDFHHFTNRCMHTPDHNEFYKTSMFFQKFVNWKDTRNKMTPVFSSGKLKYLFQYMKLTAVNLSEYISGNDRTLDAKDVCYKYVIDVVMRVFFDMEANCLRNDQAVFFKVGKDLFASTLRNGFCQFAFFFYHGLVDLFQLEFVEKRLQDFFSDIFWKAVKNREDRDTKTVHFIDMLREIRKQNPDFGRYILNSLTSPKWYKSQ